jgi:hypothetical protein
MVYSIMAYSIVVMCHWGTPCTLDEGRNLVQVAIITRPVRLAGNDIRFGYFVIPAKAGIRVTGMVDN